MLSRITGFLFVVIVPVTVSLNGIGPARAWAAAADKAVVSDADADGDTPIARPAESRPTSRRGSGKIRNPAHVSRVPGPDDIPELEAGPAKAGSGQLEMLLPMVKKLFAAPGTKKLLMRLLEGGSHAGHSKHGKRRPKLKWMQELLSH
jgi:hypothetical protein